MANDMNFTKAQVNCSQKIMKCTENSISFELKNPNKKNAKLYSVDGNLIKGTGVKKCDYMYEIFSDGVPIKNINQNLHDDAFISSKLKSFIYVELKGKNFERAVEQIEQTAVQLNTRHSSCSERLGFVVCSTTRHPNFSTKDQMLKAKLMRGHRIRLKIESRKATFSI
ncbi:hypothetical protein OC508_16780 [Vibrio vulnificus]|uniref:hypothetical protein n=1 Tax=Vibrio vulnificus TaxID=672 RepID=UPI0021DB5040|nr:hypothetical protein [Vibrio vulnificus]MCU8399269.1 hypothetical protein [Vibrio vulnificus]MDS1871127.1 hypothetical protein [Vibrio vulnificus]